MKRNTNAREPVIRSPPRPRSRGLRFSPTAWSKLLFLRDWQPAEVGGFGITAADDLLYVSDLRLVKQTCSPISVSFDDSAVADFFDEQVDLGLEPEQFSRVWIHTHPGHCPRPSCTDEETFKRVFGGTDWALMFILAAMGDTYARLRFHVGPGGELELPVGVDYGRPFLASDQGCWRAEYAAQVTIQDEFLELLQDMPAEKPPADYRDRDNERSWHV